MLPPGVFSDYAILARADGARVHAGHSSKRTGSPWGPRGRDLGMYGLVVLVSGSGVYRDERNGAQQVQPGTCMCLFPGLRHDYGGALWEEAFLDLRLPVMDLLEREGLLSRQRPVVALDRGAQRLFHRLVEDVVARRLDDLALVQLRLHELALRFATPAAGDPWDEALQRARVLLEADPAQRVTPQAAARAAAMPWETFRRRFRRRFGMGPAQWRLRHRVHHAGRLLLEPAGTATAVAAACGFCDPFHFSRQFQQVMGRSPSAFRRDHGVGR